METIDTYPLIEACWDGLVLKYEKEGLSEDVRAFIGNVGEGYPFPTNLDRRVPVSNFFLLVQNTTDMVVGNRWDGTGKRAGPP